MIKQGVFLLLAVFAILLTWEHQIRLDAVDYSECGGVFCEMKEK
jgi:hypothetical protein